MSTPGHISDEAKLRRIRLVIEGWNAGEIEKPEHALEWIEWSLDQRALTDEDIRDATEWIKANHHVLNA